MRRLALTLAMMLLPLHVPALLTYGFCKNDPAGNIGDFAGLDGTLTQQDDFDTGAYDTDMWNEHMSGGSSGPVVNTDQACDPAYAVSFPIDHPQYRNEFTGGGSGGLNLANQLYYPAEFWTGVAMYIPTRTPDDQTEFLMQWHDSQDVHKQAVQEKTPGDNGWNAATNTPPLCADGTCQQSPVYLDVTTGGSVDTGNGAQTYVTGKYAEYLPRNLGTGDDWEWRPSTPCNPASGNPCINDLSPEISKTAAIAFFIKNGEWRMQVLADAEEVKIDRKYERVVNIGDTTSWETGPTIAVVYDTWIRFVFRIVWDPVGSNGILQVWMDDLLIVDLGGQIGFNDTCGPYMKFGIYKSAWSYQSPDGDSSRLHYEDSVKVGYNANVGGTIDKASVSPSCGGVSVPAPPEGLRYLVQ